MWLKIKSKEIESFGSLSENDGSFLDKILTKIQLLWGNTSYEQIEDRFAAVGWGGVVDKCTKPSWALGYNCLVHSKNDEEGNGRLPRKNPPPQEILGALLLA